MIVGMFLFACFVLYYNRVCTMEDGFIQWCVFQYIQTYEGFLKGEESPWNVSISSWGTKKKNILRWMQSMNRGKKNRLKIKTQIYGQDGLVYGV